MRENYLLRVLRWALKAVVTSVNVKSYKDLFLTTKGDIVTLSVFTFSKNLLLDGKEPLSKFTPLYDPWDTNPFLIKWK